MCGIIGYVGPREAKPLLLGGLERLEYRGYDSAGIALCEEDGLDYVRAVGNLQTLKQRAGSNGSHSRHGLGHTRWATHGAVNDENAHPLTGCDDSKLAIVLNGIVENYRELKESLVADGHTFTSQTDAEVVAHLVERHYEGDLAEAVRRDVRATSKATSRSSSSTATTPTCSSARAARRRSWSASATARCSSPPRSPRSCARRAASSSSRTATSSRSRPRGATFLEPRRLDARGRGDRGRLGRRERREGRLRDVHAQGDLRAAGVGARDDRRPRPPRRARAREPRADRDGAPEPAPDRRRRLRHRLPRGRRRPLRARGMGAGPGRARHRERVDLPQPGAVEGHARDRDLAVRRDARHGQRDEARAARRARARSRSRT